MWNHFDERLRKLEPEEIIRFEYPLNTSCTNEEHDPPSDLQLEKGTYTWQCSACGHKTIFHTNA